MDLLAYQHNLRNPSLAHFSRQHPYSTISTICPLYIAKLEPLLVKSQLRVPNASPCSLPALPLLPVMASIAKTSKACPPFTPLSIISSCGIFH